MTSEVSNWQLQVVQTIDCRLQGMTGTRTLEKLNNGFLPAQE